jgi:hypothetical protein
VYVLVHILYRCIHFECVITCWSCNKERGLIWYDNVWLLSELPCFNFQLIVNKPLSHFMCQLNVFTTVDIVKCYLQQLAAINADGVSYSVVIPAWHLAFHCIRALQCSVLAPYNACHFMSNSRCVRDWY